MKLRGQAPKTCWNPLCLPAAHYLFSNSKLPHEPTTINTVTTRAVTGSRLQTNPKIPPHHRATRCLRPLQQRRMDRCRTRRVCAPNVPRTGQDEAHSRFLSVRGRERPRALLRSGTLAGLRAPGYIMPPFDRPAPKRFAWDDPHTPEVKADVEVIARFYRNRQACWLARPRLRIPINSPGYSAPISPRIPR
jgi:hypothetical protein